jgi:hypothetical protein
MSSLRPELLDILQHSLGLDRHGLYKGSREGYRNHFASGPECDHYAPCRELVDLGLMTERKPPPDVYPYSTFVVTDAGRDAVRKHSPQAPKLSRSQKRYRAYLSADSSMSFGEWMKSPEVRDV